MLVRRSLLPLTLTLISVAPAASAFPGFMAGKSQAPVVHSTHVALMKKDGTTVVSVMPDYQGSLEPFALVLVLPADAGPERVVTLKREFVDRLDQISAPRFHEFWEQDPCDPGPPEQEWQRNLKVQGSGFLGMGAPTGEKKVAKELFIDTKAKQKEGEYVISVLEPGASPLAWLKEKGYTPPPGAEAAVAPYVSAGMRFAVAEVDVKRVELVGGDRAQLSPIRYATEQPFEAVPVRLGLLNAPAKGKQEVFVYLLDSGRRYEVKNYKNVYPPTNIEVDFIVKERVGEFYNALYDIILGQTPDAFLVEYAWSADGCGQPCATEPLQISELLSLGADVFEEGVPEEQKNPEPPELSKEEKDALKEQWKELKPKERRQKQKEYDEDRERVAAVKALIERHKYVLTRLHYRYDQTNLKQDPKFAPASAVEGGVALPKGEKRAAATEIKPASDNRLQTRFNNFHNWKPVIHCPGPDRYRWGKSPPDYRGLRKIWIADDLTRKSRTQIKPAQVVKSELPELGLGPSREVPDAGADGSAGEAAKPESNCACRAPGGAKPDPAPGALALAALALGWFRRQRPATAKGGSTRGTPRAAK